MNVWSCPTVPIWWCGLAMILLFTPCVLAGDEPAAVRNEKVLVVERTLAPGEKLFLPNGHAGVLVYLNAGQVEAVPYSAGLPWTNSVQRGEAMFQPSVNESSARILRNAGSAALRIVTTTYLGNGGLKTWGTNGLAPDYKLLFENQYGRVYDIRMAAGKSEPRHSHHDRVVICLSGAELEHILPDGRKETSTLKTGEIAWRRGGIHVGHNLGKTDLWVIAVEPK
jgi:hypothetical protein